MCLQSSLLLLFELTLQCGCSRFAIKCGYLNRKALPHITVRKALHRLLCIKHQAGYCLPSFTPSALATLKIVRRKIDASFLKVMFFT